MDQPAPPMDVDVDVVMNDSILEEDEEEEGSVTVPISAPTGNFRLVYEEVPIYFPYTAYPCQKQMMEKIIAGVNRSENCLLESPTGTGKTVALLCSLLAWQKNDLERQSLSPSSSPKKRKLDLNGSNSNQGNDSGNCSDDSQTPCSSRASLSRNTEIISSDEIPTLVIPPSQFQSQIQSQDPNSNKNHSSHEIRFEEDQENLEPSALAFECEQHSDSSHKIRFEEDQEKLEPSPLAFEEYSSSDSGSTLKKPTKIYYATRTISQIKNVVKQLRQTKYANTPMVILASRKQTCINPMALNAIEGVEDTCDKLRNPPRQTLNPNEPPQPPPPTCSYYENSPKEKFADYGNNEPWDIEDIKRFGEGESCHSCPYYGIRRAILPKAQIIFCTYNHLLNAFVRKASEITINSNSILVFDEAHNIEDLCRELASINISLDKVDSLKMQLDLAMRGEPPYATIPLDKKVPLQELSVAVNRLSTWLFHEGKPETQGFLPLSNSNSIGKLSKEISDVVSTFSEVGFGPVHLKKLWKNFFAMEDTTNDSFKIKSKEMRYLGKILFVLQTLFKRSPENPEEFLRFKDYKMFLLKTQTQDGDVRLELKLICLNPGVCFEQVKSARTVIVTSGTLSPIDSFSSELQMEFKHVLSAGHIVSRDRIFSRIVTSLKKDSWPTLSFSYRTLYGNSNGESYEPGYYEHHQFELGQILLDIAQKVPHGLLVFASSKLFLEKLKTSWGSNACLEELRQVKDVYFEHEAKDGPTFTKMLEEYRESATRATGKGGIFFGVLRGRASEGIDFKDDEARAVVTIGIPFPPCFEESVVAKRVYNEKRNKEDKTCLSGDAWYQSSTFRALNQALGRCVRHERDWGMIFIVDARFQENFKYEAYLSRWVRDSLAGRGREDGGSLEEMTSDVNTFLQRWS